MNTNSTNNKFNNAVLNTNKSSDPEILSKTTDFKYPNSVNRFDKYSKRIPHEFEENQIPDYVSGKVKAHKDDIRKTNTLSHQVK